MIVTILVFLVILSVLVLVHEGGHFFMAKKMGIKIEEFGFGLPPRAWGKKIGETIYSLNWLPIGGFVKLYGEDLPAKPEARRWQAGEAGGGKLKIIKGILEFKDRHRAFFVKSPWQRAAVVIAGVVMNTILAVFIFYLFLFISGFKTELPLLGDHQFFFVNQKNISDIVISGVAKNSPAEKAGIRPFAKIVSVNGKKIKSVDAFLVLINREKGKEVQIIWQDTKTGKTFTGKLIPRVNPPKNEGAMGVSFFPVSVAVLTYENGLQKIFSGFIHPANLLVYNFDIMGKLIGISVKEKTTAPLSESVAGPVGIYSLVGSIVQIPNLKERILQGLNLAGILSISLAFFNILPVPALDGGRLVFILIEACTGRKIPEKYESYAHAVGMAILLTLIALITVHDLTRIFSNRGLIP